MPRTILVASQVFFPKPEDHQDGESSTLQIRVSSVSEGGEKNSEIGSLIVEERLVRGTGENSEWRELTLDSKGCYPGVGFNRLFNSFLVVGPIHRIDLYDLEHQSSHKPRIILPAWSSHDPNLYDENTGAWSEILASAFKDLGKRAKNEGKGVPDRLQIWEGLPFSFLLISFNKGKAERVDFCARQRVHLIGPPGGAHTTLESPILQKNFDPLPLVNDKNPPGEYARKFLDYISGDAVTPQTGVRALGWLPCISGSFTKNRSGDKLFTDFRIWAGPENTETRRGYEKKRKGNDRGIGAYYQNIGITGILKAVGLDNSIDPSDGFDRSNVSFTAYPIKWNGEPYDEPPYSGEYKQTPRLVIEDQLGGTLVPEIVDPKKVSIPENQEHFRVPFKVSILWHKLDQKEEIYCPAFSRTVYIRAAEKNHKIKVDQFLEVAPFSHDTERKEDVGAVISRLVIRNAPQDLGLAHWNAIARRYLADVNEAGQEESFVPVLSTPRSEAVAGEIITPSTWTIASRVVERLNPSHTIMSAENSVRFYDNTPYKIPALARDAIRYAYALPDQEKVPLSVSFEGLHPAPGTSAKPGQYICWFSKPGEDDPAAERLQLEFNAKPQAENQEPFQSFVLGSLMCTFVGGKALQKKALKGEALSGGEISAEDEPELTIKWSVTGSIDRLDPRGRLPRSWINSLEMKLSVKSRIRVTGQDRPEDSLREDKRGEIGSLFAVEPSLVFFDENLAAPVILEITENSERQSPGAPVRRLQMAVKPPASDGSDGDNAAGKSFVGVADSYPFYIVGSDSSALHPGQNPLTDVLAERDTADPAGARWRFPQLDPVTSYILPPQAVGEAMEKGALASNGGSYDIADNEPVDFRFSASAKLTAQIEERALSPQGPWNIRNLLISSAADLPGLPLLKGDFDLAYGMRTTLTGDRLRIVDASAWSGQPPRARLTRLKDVDNINASSEEQRTRYKYWGRAYRAWARRLAQFEIRDEELPGGELDRRDGVAFRLWQDEIDDGRPGSSGESFKTCEPLRDNSALGEESKKFLGGDGALAGGVLWGFESANILEAVTRHPDSVGGAIRRLALSALGGTGDQDAIFDYGRQKISTSSDFGRMNGYTLVRLGRIGVLWNRAIHVIRFERAPLVSPQFYNEGADPGNRNWGDQEEHTGRLILRKVEEYVELLEPARETGLSLLSASEFVTRRVRVDSGWGRDVTLRFAQTGNTRRMGWEVPLWNRKAAKEKPDVYPMPDIWVKAAAAEDTDPALDAVSGEEPFVRRRLLEPDKLFFYTDTQDVGPKVDAANTDLWQSVYGVDFLDYPLDSPNPQTLQLSDFAQDRDDRLNLPDPPATVSGLERFTWALAGGPRINVTAGRAKAAIGADVVNITAMRSRVKSGGARAGTSTRASAGKATAEGELANSTIRFMKTHISRDAGVLITAKKLLTASEEGLAAFRGVAKELEVALNASPFDNLPAEPEKRRRQLETAVTNAVAAAEDLKTHIKSLDATLIRDLARYPKRTEALAKKLEEKVRIIPEKFDLFYDSLVEEDISETIIEAANKTLRPRIIELRTRGQKEFEDALEPARNIYEDILMAREDLKQKVDQLAGDTKTLSAEASKFWKTVSGANDLNADSLCEWAEKELREEIQSLFSWADTRVAGLQTAIEKEVEETLVAVKTEAERADADIGKIKGKALGALNALETSTVRFLGLSPLAFQRAISSLEDARNLVNNEKDRLVSEINEAHKGANADLADLQTKLSDDFKKKIDSLVAALRTGIRSNINAAAVDLGGHVTTAEQSLADLAGKQAPLTIFARERLPNFEKQVAALFDKIPATWHLFRIELKGRLTKSLPPLIRQMREVDDAVTSSRELAGKLLADAEKAAADALDDAARQIGQAIEELDQRLATEHLRGVTIIADAMGSKGDLNFDPRIIKNEIDARVKDISDAIVAIEDALKGAREDWSSILADRIGTTVKNRIKNARSDIDGIARGSSPQEAVDEITSILRKFEGTIKVELENARTLVKMAVEGEVTKIVPKVCGLITNETFLNKARSLIAGNAAKIDDVLKAIKLFAEGDPQKPLSVGEFLERYVKTAEELLDELAQLFEASRDWAADISLEVPLEFEYRTPSFDFDLPRIYARMPELPDLGFNRRFTPMYFDFPETVRIWPSTALLDRFGEHMRGLSISWPTMDIGDIFEAPNAGDFPHLDIGSISLSDMLPDWGWLKNSGLFSGKSIGSSAETGIKITHGIDKKNKVAWAKAAVELELGSADLLPPEIMRLTISNTRMEGHLRLETNLKGEVQRDVGTVLSGDWALGAGAVTIVTLREAQLTYSEGDGPNLKIDPSKIDYSGGLALFKAISDAVMPEGDHSDNERLFEDGLPTAFSSRINIPIPDIGIGAFTFANIQFGAAVEALLLPEFKISASANLGSVLKPVVMTVSFLGGGGFMRASTDYFPLSGSRATEIDIAFGVAAGGAFNLGPLRGAVIFWLGMRVRYRDRGSGGGALSTAAIMTINGSVNAWGIITVSVGVMLAVEYDGSSAIGYGHISVSVRISRFYKKSFSQSFEKRLSGSGSGQQGHTIAMLGAGADQIEALPEGAYMAPLEPQENPVTTARNMIDRALI